MSVFYIILITGISALLSYPLAKAMTCVMEPEETGTTWRNRVDEGLKNLCGGGLAMGQNWKQYAVSMLVFSGVMFVGICLVLTLQHVLPLNPDGKGPLSLDLIFHTAASFVTNTNLQHYSGEVSMSYFAQIFGLMTMQFLSAGTGIAVFVALSRGLAGRTDVGNFYMDLLRAVFFVLLPLALIVAFVLCLGGVVMTFSGAVQAKTLEGAVQTIARGPVAAFMAIKQLGTNGGGFFGANSAHPFENPSWMTNIIESVCIILIPMACVFMFGRITKRMRHAVLIFAVMLLLLLVKAGLAVYFESEPAAAFSDLPIRTEANMEGKELRFGAGTSALWAALTTATSNGSVNCMHDSLNPLTGLVVLSGMWLNTAFGGVGVGFISMFLFIIVGVFISGMMVGRTPEYLNKKVETHEMKLALMAVLVHPIIILGGTALFSACAFGASTVLNQGPHGFTEILYEFTSSAANNGSGFEGLSDNTVMWNLSTGLAMILARFAPILLPLAISGSLAAKKPSPETAGTLRTDTMLFALVILGSVIFIGALLFMPVAVLGPVAEHLAR